MRKDLKKNKKGFTLVEIIVVLLIIGILLAITIPSIMGYVSQAKDAQFEAEGRSGYVAAQTLTARNNTTPGDTTATITKDTIGEELGDTTTILKAGCTFGTDRNLTKCVFVTKGLGADSTRGVIFEEGKDVKVDTIPTDFTAGDFSK